jgi:hypothetical protein
VEAFAVGGLGRVGVGPGVRDAVAVGRPAAEVPAFGSGLGRHRGPDPDLDPVPFSLRHAAKHRHDQIVGFRGGVDRSADLGNPERDAVVLEDGVHEAVLVAVERPVRLADDDRVEATAGVTERSEQTAGLRAALPGDRSGLADIEVLRENLTMGVGESSGAGELPGQGGLGVLLVLSGDPAVEREVGQG